MPIISFFYGIVIRMNFSEHEPPYFHAEYQGYKAAIDLNTGIIMAGEMPKNAEKLIRIWTRSHKTELLENWERIKKKEPLLRIQGVE